MHWPGRGAAAPVTPSRISARRPQLIPASAWAVSGSRRSALAAQPPGPPWPSTHTVGWLPTGCRVAHNSVVAQQHSRYLTVAATAAATTTAAAAAKAPAAPTTKVPASLVENAAALGKGRDYVIDGAIRKP